MSPYPSYEAVKTDFLILGSGVGGLRAAIELAPYGSVLMVNKGGSFESATGYAQGGIAVAMHEGDSWEAHLEDTLRAGKDLCQRQSVEVLVKEGPRRVQELIDWGGHFDQKGNEYVFAREGAHSQARILHAGGDATGVEILRTLSKKAEAFSSVTRLDNCFSAELLVLNGVCIGAVLLKQPEGPPTIVGAKGVLLATGGAGRVFSRTTNPKGATGDGIAMAYRAGAQLVDMEFVQFHPTALSLGDAPPLLLTEAMRGEGAKLINAKGERFMSRYHPDEELAPRDTAARAIIEEMRLGGSDHVYLDITHYGESYLKERFPTIFKTCLRYGIDISKDQIPVSPSAHFNIGGVQTSLEGETTLPGLFAAGEVAACGVHGANRLASNSLLEGLVFGTRAAVALSKRVAGPPTPTSTLERIARETLTGKTAPSPSRHSSLDSDRRQLSELIWSKVGIVRTQDLLLDVIKQLQKWDRAEDEWELNRSDREFRNLLTLAKLITRAALLRMESRGVHFRSDYPQEDKTWNGRHISFRFPDAIL